MESAKQSRPERNVSDYTFLYPFYRLDRLKVMAGSPETAAAANRERADRLAVRLVEKMNYFERAYGETGFPVLNLNDPCELLSSLAVRFWAVDETPSYRPLPHIKAGLSVAATSIRGEGVPDFMRRLGRLEIQQYAGKKPYITEIELNQPAGSRLILHKQTSPIHGWSDDSYIGGYPENAQAMNFIDMVEEYLDKLEQNRLMIVRD